MNKNIISVVLTVLIVTFTSISYAIAGGPWDSLPEKEKKVFVETLHCEKSTDFIVNKVLPKVGEMKLTSEGVDTGLYYREYTDKGGAGIVLNLQYTLKKVKDKESPGKLVLVMTHVPSLGSMVFIDYKVIKLSMDLDNSGKKVSEDEFLKMMAKTASGTHFCQIQ